MRPIADCGAGVRVERHIDHDLPKEFAFAVEHLNSTVAAIRDIHRSLGVDGDAVRSVELPWTIPGFAP